VLGLENTTAFILHLFFSSTYVYRLTLQRIPNTLLWISNLAESKLHCLSVVYVMGLESGGWVAVFGLWPPLTRASQEIQVSYLETHHISKDLHLVRAEGVGFFITTETSALAQFPKSIPCHQSPGSELTQLCHLDVHLFMPQIKYVHHTGCFKG